MTSVARHIEAFLREYLVRHRGNSKHTCESYAYSFQLLFEFASQRLEVPPSSIALEQLDAALICSFLEHLEKHPNHPFGGHPIVLPVSTTSGTSRTRPGPSCSRDSLQENR